MPTDPFHAIPKLTEDWVKSRLDLHKQYESDAGLNDSSRLGYMCGDRKRWTEDEVIDLWRQAAEQNERRQDAINHVYVHVPYCKSICNFCNYERLRPSDPELIDRFVDRVMRSLHDFAPVVEPLTWHTMYFGGGTASVLPAKKLEKILIALDETLRWHPRSTRFFEFDPAIMNASRIEVLVKHGFEHFSFGVQTLDAENNQQHNRGKQGRELIAKRFQQLRDYGIYNISCDFLLGLANTTPEQMAEELEYILAFRPRWVDLYYLTPTREYMDSHFGGSFDPFWEHIRQFYDRIPELIKAAAKRNGYRMRRGHGHNIVVYRQMGTHERKGDGKNGIFSYTQLVDQQRRPLHLLGLGTSARSLIFGQAALECRDPEEMNDPENRHNYFGSWIGMEGEIRLFLAHMLRDNDAIDRAMFKRIFGMDITEAIPTTLAIWDKLGKLTLTDDEMRLKREERRERVRTLLWCVPDARIQHEVDRHEFNRKAQARKRESDSHKST